MHVRHALAFVKLIALAELCVQYVWHTAETEAAGMW